MKQCVKCRTLFGDENLRFCRYDGSPLNDEVIAPEEAATILFTSEQLTNMYPALQELRRAGGSGKLYE